MQWTTREQAGAVVIRPEGRIDESNWQIFSDALTEALPQAEAAGGRLVVDFSGVDYMSSRGLRALTMAKKAAGEAVEISFAAPNPRMREIFAISRYDRIFTVHDTVP